MTEVHEAQEFELEGEDALDDGLDMELSIYDDEGAEYLERSQRHRLQLRRDRPARRGGEWD